MTAMLKVYGNYMNNLDNILEIIRKAKKKKDFVVFLEVSSSFPPFYSHVGMQSQIRKPKWNWFLLDGSVKATAAIWTTCQSLGGSNGNHFSPTPRFERSAESNPQSIRSSHLVQKHPRIPWEDYCHPKEDKWPAEWLCKSLYHLVNWQEGIGGSTSSFYQRRLPRNEI